MGYAFKDSRFETIVELYISGYTKVEDVCGVDRDETFDGEKTYEFDLDKLEIVKEFAEFVSETYNTDYKKFKSEFQEYAKRLGLSHFRGECDMNDVIPEVTYPVEGWNDGTINMDTNLVKNVDYIMIRVCEKREEKVYDKSID